MLVYKFGGASVKDAEGIKNLHRIVSKEKDLLLVVVSAFGKTTNALEKVLRAWISGDVGYKLLLEDLFQVHRKVAGDLFPEASPVIDEIELSFSLLRNHLLGNPSGKYDYEYDQVVSFGELWSTIIVEGFLRSMEVSSEWVDIRKILLTDDRYRDANILWSVSLQLAKEKFTFSDRKVYVTQGFIGGTAAGRSTTFGREGSDYTAAVLGNMLDAGEVVLWKDVPGILNADPKWMPGVQKLDTISYKEAVEMTFSGAKVIHPKTIKPLHNKGIPLIVRSFIDPGVCGTVITADARSDESVPVFMKKEEQILISILPRDFSFAMGDNLGMVFHSFLTNGVKVNLVQASAVSINVCVDDERDKIDSLINELKDEYKLIYNENVEILSVRHQTPGAVELITKDREVLLEQKTRKITRVVMRRQ